jgi:hypothetical protein
MLSPPGGKATEMRQGGIGFWRSELRSDGNEHLHRFPVIVGRVVRALMAEEALELAHKVAAREAAKL